MYIAKDTGGAVQPISASPTLTFGAEVGTTYVSFGTGKYLELNDKSSTSIQSFYTIYDNASTALDSSPATAALSAITGRGQLLAATVSTTANTVTTSAFTWGRRPKTTTTGDVYSGWYADFPSGAGHSGERVVSNATVFGKKLIFGSLIPSSTGSTSTCSGTVGSGFQYTIDYTTGNGSFIASSVGIMGEPLVAEIESAATYSKSDSTGRRTKTITVQVFQQGANGVSAITGSSGQQTRTVVSGRLTWRQINNYQDLKNAP
jgi:type IV pilus assembly protein PilY1